VDLRRSGVATIFPDEVAKISAFFAAQRDLYRRKITAPRRRRADRHRREQSGLEPATDVEPGATARTVDDVLAALPSPADDVPAEHRLQ
jgi:hypothetical protein